MKPPKNINHALIVFFILVLSFELRGVALRRPLLKRLVSIIFAMIPFG